MTLESLGLGPLKLKSIPPLGTQHYLAVSETVKHKSVSRRNRNRRVCVLLVGKKETLTSDFYCVVKSRIACWCQLLTAGTSLPLALVSMTLLEVQKARRVLHSSVVQSSIIPEISA